GHLHNIRVFECVLELGFNFVAVFCLKTRGDLWGCVFRYLGHYSSFPAALAKRTLTVLVTPSSSTSSKRSPTRVGFSVSGSTTATLEMCRAASCSTSPPSVEPSAP